MLIGFAFPFRTCKQFLVGGGLLALCACASPRLEVQTKPDGAEVYAIRQNQSPLKLGTTPLSISRESNPGLFTDGVELQLSKEGYSNESLLIPKSMFGTELRLDVALKEVKLPAACTDADQMLNEIAQGVAESQHLIFKKDFSGASQRLTQLMGKFPNVATLYALFGNISYLEKDLSTALNYYRKAHQLQPENGETDRMIERINAIRGKDGAQ